MHVRTYRVIPSRHTGKWFVVNECDETEAGPYDTKKQAEGWIKKQSDAQQGIDG